MALEEISMIFLFWILSDIFINNEYYYLFILAVSVLHAVMTTISPSTRFYRDDTNNKLI